MARRDFGFGGVSARARSEADEFFAELLGRSPRARGLEADEGFDELFGEQVGGAPCPPPGPIPATCLGVSTREIIDCFDHGSHTVLPRHQPKLVNLARCILASQSTATPINTLQMIGHADSSGGTTPNDALGQRRADAV